MKTSLIEDAVKIKALEILEHCEKNYKGLQEPEGEMDWEYGWL